MDNEVELNYRLTGHLEAGEKVLETLISVEHGIYAATDQRILCLNTDRIGYRLRIHPYDSLDRVDCLTEDDAWFVRFSSDGLHLMVGARTEKEARRFAAAVTRRLVEPNEQTA